MTRKASLYPIPENTPGIVSLTAPITGPTGEPMGAVWCPRWEIVWGKYDRFSVQGFSADDTEPRCVIHMTQFAAWLECERPDRSGGALVSYA